MKLLQPAVLKTAVILPGCSVKLKAYRPADTYSKYTAATTDLSAVYPSCIVTCNKKTRSFLNCGAYKQKILQQWKYFSTNSRIFA